MTCSGRRAVQANVKKAVSATVLPTRFWSGWASTDLLLNERELVQVPLEERHLLLLVLGVGSFDDRVVVLAKVVQLDLEFDDLKRIGRGFVSPRRIDNRRSRED